MTAAYHAHLPCPQSLVLASRACTRVRWNNSWTTEHHGVHPSASFSPLFWSLTPSSFTSPPPLHSFPRARLPSLFYSPSFLLAFRSVKKKKKRKRNEYRATLVFEYSNPPPHFIPFSPLPPISILTIANENRRFSSLKNLGEFQVFLFSSLFCSFFFLSRRTTLPLLILKKLLTMRRGIGKGEARTRINIVPREKKVLNLSNCENDEVARAI